MISRAISYLTWRPWRYLVKKSKTPVVSTLQFSIGGYATYWLLSKAYADAVAFEHIRTYVQNVAKLGNLQEVNNQSERYHLSPSTNILVIMNPAASGGQSGKHFEKYIRPILEVSGFDMYVHKTEGVKDARDLCLDLLKDKFSMILVVGGDGTISEVLTGISHRNDGEEFLSKTPIAIIPTGKKNTIYQTIIKNQASKDFYDSPATTVVDCAIHESERLLSALNSGKSLLEQCTSEDVFKVNIQLKGETESQAEILHKPVYGLGSVQWGVERDAAEKRKALWFIVPFKDRLSRFLVSRKESAEQTVELDMQYDRETVSQKFAVAGRLGSKSFREEVIDIRKSDRVATVKDHDNLMQIFKLKIVRN